MTATSVFAKMQRGHHDDGREGIILAKIAAGDLVKVPFGSGGSAQNGLSKVIGSATASSQTNLTTNPDGSGTGVNFSIPPGLAQGGSWTEVVYGSVVGVRWRRNTGSTVLPFAVVIDGVAYTQRNAKLHHHVTVPSSNSDSETLWIVADDLNPDVPHTVQVIMVSDAYGATTKALLAYGWLLERSRGYKDPPRWGSIGTPASLATSTTSLAVGFQYRKILLHNTNATTARTVTFKSGASILKVVPLAAATSAEIDFGATIGGSSGFTLQVDAGTDVTWAPIYAEAR